MGIIILLILIGIIVAIVFVKRTLTKIGHWNDARMATNYFRKGGHAGVPVREREHKEPHHKRHARKVENHYRPMLRSAAKRRDPETRHTAIEAVLALIHREQGYTEQQVDSRRYDPKENKVKPGVRRHWWND